MKIQLLSDLHLEFAPFEYQPTDADVVVLAGDIHTKHRAIDWIKTHIKNKPVIYVLGNHEYYKSAYPKLLKDLKQHYAPPNVFILEQDFVSIDVYNFLGCTLWTDFELFGDAKVAGYHCQQVMNDYRKIRRSPSFSRLRSVDTAIFHFHSRKWLEETLLKHQGETNIVVTHHAPSILSVAEHYRSELTTAAYASDLSALVEHYQPSLWLHGHLHNSSKYVIDGCRIVCNPKGYYNQENPDFDPEFCINV
ncbi:metallophosphoesterase [Pleionea sp. CnH1-48]|uniref:metallophosphoesterase n=1 Tax=Pleionea sp. CnH1-48 TaxID=2954494 RepID=UPI0020983529|nr:metallophosphoesterase [Pleionea sp. CnH1-48]MCO7226679.1 metallophosphoesterase [Pleionea sp. CnH1-48]